MKLRIAHVAGGLGAIVFAFHAALVAAASSPSAQPRRIEVQGHRGARAMRPENTLPAFAYALDLGVDVLELDLQVSKDQQLIISHDPFISPKRCLHAGKALAQEVAIRGLTLAEIRAYDCGSLRHESFPRQLTVPGTPLPTLGQLFAMVRVSTSPHANTVKFNIETKVVPRYADWVPKPEVFVQMILDTAKTYGMLDRIIIQSFDHRTLAAAKKLAPQVPISPLLSTDLPDFGALATQAKAEVISPHVDWVSADAVQSAHAAKARVVAWTANTPADWDYLLACDVDGIISDDPAALIAYLRSKGRR